MSQYLDTRKVGDTIDVSGPWGTHEYVGRGKMMSGKKEHKFKKLGMMAGGTGITPMLQVMQAILKDPRDSTVISLLYANQTEDDILVRDYLEGLKAEHPKRLNLWYTVDRPKEGWTYSSGFITAEMISEHLPPAAPDTLVIMCACTPSACALSPAAGRQLPATCARARPLGVRTGVHALPVRIRPLQVRPAADGRARVQEEPRQARVQKGADDRFLSTRE